MEMSLSPLIRPRRTLLPSAAVDQADAVLAELLGNAP